MIIDGDACCDEDNDCGVDVDDDDDDAFADALTTGGSNGTVTRSGGGKP